MVGRVVAGDILDAIAELKARYGGEIIALNPMAVCGKDHVLSVYMHAKRAFESGTSTSRDFAGEFMRYLSGERQISRAIEKAGVKDGDSVVMVSDVDMKEVERALRLKLDDSILGCTEEKARYLGLNDGFPPEEMVLELVAMVAVL